MVFSMRGADREGAFSGNRVERAIIDIGSNTIRLVLYGGSPRAPVTLFNEKVAARLGREIASTGRLADDSMEMALRGLGRFALLLQEWDVKKVDVVATAAVREASNGPEFLDRVRSFGFEPRVLPGEDEARISAMGIVGAFPDAKGIVADLGGGSLELVQIAGSKAASVAAEGVSLPLGTLRLPEYRAPDGPENGGGPSANLLQALETTASLDADGGNLYLVGGTWRAMAMLAMAERAYPLTDPHGFNLTADEALALAVRLEKTAPEELGQTPRVSQMRAEYLPDASVLLQALLSKFSPERVVFSSWGLREGILFDELLPFARLQDPLLAGVSEFAALRGAPSMLGAQVAGWTVGVLAHNNPEENHANGPANAPANGYERLRLASTMLALASMQIEPNLRVDTGINWALHKRWIDIDAKDRAMMAASMVGNAGRFDLPKLLYELASEEQLEQAICWGLAVRLSRRLIGRARRLFNVCSLFVEGGELVLSLDQSHAGLYGIPTERDMALLADRMSLVPTVRIDSSAG